MGGRSGIGWTGKPGRNVAIVLVFSIAAVARVSVQHRGPATPVNPAVITPRPPFGIVAFDLNPPAPRVLQTLGVGVVGGSCGWQVLEPARGVFNWDCADNVIMGAHQIKLKSAMTVLCTPGWANNNRGCAEMPADISDWYFFVANFVTRYQNFDTMLGVWNEPNFDFNLDDTPAGDRYALLFINASNARNSVNRTFPLVGPETSHHALASGYLAGTMKSIDAYGAFDSQDVFGVHWYPDGPPLFNYLDAVHAIGSARDVWLTETGIAANDPAQQAAFYDGVLRAFAASNRPWWTRMTFYRLWDGTDCCTESIVRSDYSPKPAFTTYQSWIMKSPVPPGPSK
jgi:hypothetical protein